MKARIQYDDVERYRKIQQRKKRSRIIGLVIIILIIMIFTMLMIVRILNHYKPAPRFMFLTEKEISDDYEVKALIIRDETVFRSPADGTVRSLFADGSRIAKNEKLAYVIPEQQIDELKELQTVENEIINYQYELIEGNGNAGAKQIDYETSGQIRDILSNVYTGLINKEFSDLATDEAALNSVLDLRNERLRDYDFKDSRLEELLNHYHELESEIGLKSNVIQSSQSGIFIRTYDGLEDRLNPANIDKLSAEQLTDYLENAPQGRLEQINLAQKDQPLYCLTNSIEQYFAFFIPAGKSTDVQVSSKVDAITRDGVHLKDGLVIKSEETTDGTMIIMRCNTSLERLSDRRVVSLNVELNKESGLRVPLSALIDFKPGNVEAEIMIEKNGYIEKTQVRIQKYNPDYALIESLENAEYQIGPSTMIVLNPDDVSAGDSATGLP
ncbi:MAG: HlyD family efflux transporter periplasmic adaptor subunit [Saccharofermentanales bacterium]